METSKQKSLSEELNLVRSMEALIDAPPQVLHRVERVRQLGDAVFTSMRVTPVLAERCDDQRFEVAMAFGEFTIAQAA